MTTINFVAFIENMDTELIAHFGQFRALRHVILLIKLALAAKKAGEMEDTYRADSC